MSEGQRDRREVIDLHSVRKALVENALDGIIVMDSRGRVLEFNPAAGTIFGYGREEALGRSLGELIVPPALRPAHESGMQRFLATGEATVLGRRIEIEGMHRDGRCFPVELAITALGQHDQDPIFIAHLRDISERRQTEAELREGKARLRQLTEHIDAALWLGERATGRALYVSPGTERLTGIDPERMRTVAAWVRCVHPADRARLIHALREPGARMDLEFCIQRGDGDRWVHFRTYPVADDEGEYTRVAGLATDVTARKDTERRLRMTSFMVERAGDAIFWVGRDARIDYVNDAACRSLGHGRDELVGMTILEIDPVMDEDGWESFWAELERRGSFSLESEHRRRDGSTFPVELVVNHVRFDGRDYSCAHVRDISERREAERTVREALQRTEAASQAKDEFLSNLSHELRTPLAAVLGYAERIGQERAGDPEVQEWVQVIRSSGGLLDRILEDLLELGRIQSGRLSIVSRDCRLEDLVETARRSFEDQARKQGLHFEARAEGIVPLTFRSDPDRLQQVLINLLSNAVKYTLRGRVELVVRADRPDGEGAGRLHLEVRDTGPGIPAESQERVFQRFVQVGPFERGARAGVGLGLPIVAAVTELLGGALVLDSRGGSGTRVCVSVPVEQGATWGELVHASAPRPPAARASAPSFSGRVLLADDALELAELYAAWLRRWGLEVTVVHDGDQVLEAVAREDFDLVLMDQRMPVVDGLTATRRLRELGFERPIVGITAHTRLSARREWEQAGCTAYLLKPADAASLAACLERFLPARAGAAAGNPGQERAAHLADLRARFRQAALDSVAELRLCLAAGDDERALAEAHRLKGSAGSFGLSEVSRAAARLEDALRAVRREEAGAALDEMAEALRRRDEVA